MINRRELVFGGAGITANLSVASLAQATADKDFLRVLRSLGSFRILSRILSQPVMRAALNVQGGVTVLAPPDRVFASMPNGQLRSMMLPSNRDRLKEIMLRHILPGRFTTALYQGRLIQVESVSSFPIIVDLRTTNPTANGVPLALRDADFSNGTIHVLNGVL